MTAARAEEFELDNKIDKFGHSVGKINGMIRTAFPTLNLCLYVWMGNTFDVGFSIIMMDYFNRIFNSYNFFPHFLNWMSDRWPYEELATKIMNVPDMQNNILKVQDHKEYSVQMKGDYSWGFVAKDKLKKIDEAIDLKGMDFKIKKGEFVCVVGPVGSGKTSLLNAIAGNMLYLNPEVMKNHSGKDKTQEELVEAAQAFADAKVTDAPIKVCGSIAFAEQKSWIENKTIKETILFG